MRKLSNIHSLCVGSILVLASGATENIFAASARSGKAHSVGTGIVYPTLNHSLFVNPAALVDSPKVSLQGAYLVDPEDFHASVTSGGGVYGVGAGARHFSNNSIEDFGIGLKANVINLGLAAHSSSFENFSYDFGIAFDMGKFRVASVLRDITDGISRYDFGIGFLVHQATVEFDAKWNGDDSWYFDAALAVGTKLSVGVGYTFAYFNGSFHEGDIHAGLSAEVGKSLALEAFYRPHPQEWSTGDWVLGAKLVF